MIVNLCSGAGGWEIAARELGIAPVIGIEKDLDACLTARAAGFHVVRADIRTFPLERLVGRVTGLIASPPCPLFSQAGKRAGIKYLRALCEYVRTRLATLSAHTPFRDLHPGAPADAELVLEPLRYALDLRPEWIACEQVPDVLPVWQAITDVLEGLGYSAWAGNLLAADYGTPQTRTRAILLASRVREVGPPEPTHAQNPHPRLDGVIELPWVSMAQALGWGAGDEMHRVRGSGMIERRSIDEPAPVVDTKAGGAWQVGEPGHRVHLATGAHGRPNDRSVPRTPDEPAPTIALGHTAAEWQWVLSTGEGWEPDGSAQVSGDRPSPTISTRAGGQWYRGRPATTVAGTRLGRPGHKNRDKDKWEAQFENEAVRVTLEELAILQDAAGHPFVGTKSSKARQIGNMIPSKLARACLEAVA